MVAALLLLTLTAAPEPVAVFAASPTSPGAAAQAESVLVDGLLALKIPVVDVASKFPAPPSDGRGAQLVADARRAFDDLDTDAADRLAHQALAAFAQHPESADSALLAEAYVLVGAVAQQQGKPGKRKADDAFMRAALALPTFTLDPKSFSPDVKRAWDKAHRELESKPKRRLTFSSSPPGATVEFRGQRVGVTPITQPMLVPPGSHFVRFTKPGYVPVGVFGEVTADLEATATLLPTTSLDAMRRAVSQVILKTDDGDGPDDEVAIDIAKRLGARFVVLAKVTGPGRGTLEVWDTATPNRLKNVALSADTRGALDEVKRFVIGASLIPVAATEPRVAVSHPGEGPWIFRRWWFWAAVGGVAAGAAAAGIVAAATAPQPPAWNPVLDFP